MSKLKRVVVELLLPPLAGALVCGVPAACFDLKDAPKILLYCVAVAYTYASVPSIAYTVSIEVAFARGLDPKKARAVGVSSLFGLLAGFAVLLIAMRGRYEQLMLKDLFVFPSLGLMVGFIVGAVVRALETKDVASERV